MMIRILPIVSLLVLLLLVSTNYMVLFADAANEEKVHVSDDGRLVKKTIHVGGQKDEMGFTKEEKFQDLFPLTEDDFEERVVESADPWIILFHNGMIDKPWKSLAVALRGIVWFGTIHKLEQEDLIDELKYPLKKGPPARVYPWGSSRLKKKWTDVESPAEAKTLAIESLPDPSLKFVPDELHDFLFASYSTIPSRLPVVFFAKAETLTPIFKSIALHYYNYFNFGFIQNPTKDDMDVFQYRLGLPGMIVLIAKEFATTDPDERQNQDYDFDVISYSPESQGALNYMNIVKFLYGINYQFRKTLPGMNYVDDEEILEMEEEMELEKLRFDVKYVNEVKEVATYDPFHVNVKRSPGAKKSQAKASGDGKEKVTKGKGKGQEKKKTKKEKKEIFPEQYEEGRKFGKKKTEL